MKNINRIFSSCNRLFVIFICCFFLFSCVMTSNDEYPSEWSPIANSEKNICPDITGKYSNEGQTTHGYDGNLTNELTSLMSGNEGLNWITGIEMPEYHMSQIATHVEFILSSQNKLEIIIWAYDKEIIFTELTKENRDFSCNNNFITLISEKDFGASAQLATVGVGQSKLHLTKSNDNSLIMSSTYKGVLVAILVPVYGSDQYWGRFKAIDVIDVNARDNDGDTVLMRASRFGHIEMVKYLVDKGADVNARDNAGMTALIIAMFSGRGEIVEIAKLLLDKGTDVNARDNHGWTALMRASQSGLSEEVIKVLVDKGADVNARDNDGMTALMRASQSGLSEEVIKVLVDKGAEY